MPTCRRCEQRFPNLVVIDGQKRNLCSRKYCLQCSPFRAHNTRAIALSFDEDRAAKKAARRCKRCDREYVFDHQKGHLTSICNSCSANGKRGAMKRRAVDHKGGACQLCGYKRCLRSLVFHHLDPAEKDWSPNSKELCRSWSAIRAELDKCVLLCANCHGEVHDGVATIPHEQHEGRAVAR